MATAIQFIKFSNTEIIYYSLMDLTVNTVRLTLFIYRS